MKQLVIFVFILLNVQTAYSGAIPESNLPQLNEETDEDHFHDFVNDELLGSSNINEIEKTSSFWVDGAQSVLEKKLYIKSRTGVAKNVILFIGDGMSIPTVSSSRFYLGQETGKPGDIGTLAFDNFPYSGLSKTYCVNTQVADSACSATAYFCGVKGNRGTIGVNGAVPHKSCEQMQNTKNHVDSIVAWSQAKGKSTGIVTTTRVTHASPAGSYAHTAARSWECDADVAKNGHDPQVCQDIATQLVHGQTGKNFNVIFGGGRTKFLPKKVKDEDGHKGSRLDKRNLIHEWLNQTTNGKYISNRDQLLKLSKSTEKVLGLFASSHLDYNLEKKSDKQPSLKEMTKAAIKVLSKNSNGYFLFVEGGRIDHGHHSTKAHKALNETIEFHKAIKAAVEMTSSEETLIVVTSDHSHVMSFNGYPGRGLDILGISGNGGDGLPYSTLSYANGPGYRKEIFGERHDISNDDMREINYAFPAAVPKSSETHGGDDVGIFASGPWEHLFSGVMEQSVIPHIMAYASCVGHGKTVCDEQSKQR